MAHIDAKSDSPQPFDLQWF